MTFDGADTDEVLFEVVGEQPHDAADTRLEGQLSIAPDRAEGPPPYLSPSSSSTFNSCQKRWQFRYIHRLADPPGEAAIAGTFAHHVLELLMEEPGPARTVERAKAIAREVWPQTAELDDFIALGFDEAEQRRFRWLAWTAIEGLWKLEDPTQINVVANEQKVDTHLGDVPFRGIVDRLERGDSNTGSSTDGPLVVSDYKSGRAPSPRFADGRLEQVLLYAAAIEASTGERPTKARLLYLGQQIIETDVTEEALSSAVGALGETWVTLNSAVERDSFEAKPGPLCGWCPYASECPEGLAELEARHISGRIRSSAPSLRFLASAV